MFQRLLAQTTQSGHMKTNDSTFFPESSTQDDRGQCVESSVLENIKEGHGPWGAMGVCPP